MYSTKQSILRIGQKKHTTASKQHQPNLAQSRPQPLFHYEDQRNTHDCTAMCREWALRSCYSQPKSNHVSSGRMGIGEMFVSHEQAQTCGPIQKLASASGVESEEKLWFERKQMKPNNHKQFQRNLGRFFRISFLLRWIYTGHWFGFWCQHIIRETVIPRRLKRFSEHYLNLSWK